MAEGRRITWIGTVPDITTQIFLNFDTALQTQFGVTRIGAPQYQTAGLVTVASSLYNRVLAQALIKVTPEATLTLYLNLLWDGVPDMAGLKAMVQSTFSYIGVTILEDTVTL